MLKAFHRAPDTFGSVPVADLTSMVTKETINNCTDSNIHGPYNGYSSNSSNQNRVWIKRSSIDEALNGQKKQSNSKNQLSTSTTTQPTIFTSGTSSTTTSPVRNGRNSFSHSTTKTPYLHNSASNLSNLSFSSSFSSVGGGTGSFSESSPFGPRRKSVGPGYRNNGASSNSAIILPASLLATCCSSGGTQETETSSIFTESSNNSGRQSNTWGWLPGYLIENAGGHISVQLASSDNQISPSIVRLPSNSLTLGDVVLSNDYYTNPDTGLTEAPNDLITLTHLHEPAVIESLQHRYAADQIYTNTGPVLLALNPFQTIRGLYGDAVQKRYWERAERNSNQELPPHVYAIADEAFRSMVRALEDNGNQATKTANQSILVSGESGAGKTVTTKFVMKYLAALSHRSTALQKSNDKRAYLKASEGIINSSSAASVTGVAPYCSPRFAGSGSSNSKGWSGSFMGIAGAGESKLKSFKNSCDEMGSPSSILSVTAVNDFNNSIEAQVLQSNPILESFGNARTMRNDNSSRFGKFIEIQFTQTGKLVGAQIETYLLEKVRLITQSPGERNYHIFYELLSGAIDRRELTQYFLAHTAAPEDFKLTSNSGTYDRRDGVSDRETYGMLRQAMKTMKFSSEDTFNVFKVTAAILHASNLSFVDIPGTNGEECQLDTKNIHLEPVCLLLGVSVQSLNQALCTYTIQAGKSTAITRLVNKTKAASGLGALLKETYGALFNYLVNRVNGSIAFKNIHSNGEESKVDGLQDNQSNSSTAVNESSSPSKPAASVGVLDIFGFESFNKNSFEQLCINYCNEALQQQFNAFVLRNEQAEYEAEGIEWSFIEFPENQDAIDLIDSNSGILRILDDQCRAPGPSDKSFAINVYQQCSASNRFIASRKQQATYKFSILHYAGPVEYSVDGFIEKNRDELPKESKDLLLQSEVSFVQLLAQVMIEQSEAASSLANVQDTAKAPRLHHADSSVSRATVGGQFRRQLKVLRLKIDNTSPHYIRCLKPNDNLVPEQFDTAVVAEQLRCGGILEAVRVARAGFTQHYLHADFVRRYRGLCWKELSTTKSAWSGSAPRTPVGKAIGNTRNFRNTRHSTGSFASPKVPFLASSQSLASSSGGKSKHFASSTKSNLVEEEMTDATAKLTCQELFKILYRKIQQQLSEDTDTTSASGTAPSESSSPTTLIPPPPFASSCSASPTTKSLYSAPTWSFKSPASIKAQASLKSPTTFGLKTQASLKSPTALKPKALSPTASSSRSLLSNHTNFGSPLLALTSPTNSKAYSQSAGAVKPKITSLISPADQKGKPPAGSPTSHPPAWKKRVSTVSASEYGKVGIQLGKTKVFLRHKAFESLERLRSTEQNRSATKLNAMFRTYLARIAYIPYRDAFRQELKDRMRMFEHATEYKECKEDEFGDGIYSTSITSGVGSAIPLFCNSNFQAESLVDKWTESLIRDAIRNPIPRHQWGKVAPSQEHSFKWVISDEGLWVKNYSVLQMIENDDRF